MRSLILASLILGGAAITAACLMPASDCTFDGTCPGVSPDGSASSGGEAGTTDAEGGAEPSVPPGCDPNADGRDSLACAVTSYALFVNANAPEGGDGSKERPFREIQAALDATTGSGKRRIYICGNATYAQHLKMTASTYARLLGGFDCATWSPAEQKPKVLPGDAGYALHIDTVASEVRIEDVAFEAIAGTSASRSSIAVFVASSPNVLFKRADIKANAGADGADGTAGKAGVSTPAVRDGLAATGTIGAAAKSCECDTGGISVGGRGGDTNGAAKDGQRGLPVIEPPSPLDATGDGQLGSTCNANGLPAKKGSRGADGANALVPPPGIVDAQGWKPGDGASGESGKVGQGGGGGGGYTAGDPGQNGGGGGGGCGGCGGGGGTGGSGGGSSVAILSFASTVSIVAARLETATGGKGGIGQPGAGGSSGGGKGAKGGIDGCDGAGGGAGGNGGAGAGGAGGSSVTVLFAGPAPNIGEGVVLANGKNGLGGLGGAPTVNDGPEGLNGTILSLP